jgi:hypothetical protein
LPADDAAAGHEGGHGDAAPRPGGERDAGFEGAADASRDAADRLDATSTPDVTLDPLPLPPDASLPAICASGPSILYADNDADAGSTAWPIHLGESDATWWGQATGNALFQMNVVPANSAGKGWTLVLSSRLGATISTGRYLLPSQGGVFASVSMNTWGCSPSAGAFDLFGYSDTGGASGELRLLQAAFDLRCADGSTLTGCINYESSPSIPPPDPATDPADPMAGCGGSARDVVRIGSSTATSVGTPIQVSAGDNGPGDITVSGGDLYLDITPPDGQTVDVATYGPDAAPGAALPTLEISDGQTSCQATASSFVLYDWKPPDASGLGSSLVVAFECDSTDGPYKGCVRYQE